MQLGLHFRERYVILSSSQRPDRLNTSSLSAEVTDDGSYTSTPHYVLMAFYVINYAQG
jgi:hypothetical protein